MACETACEAKKLNKRLAETDSATLTSTTACELPAKAAENPPANPRNIFRFFDGTNRRGIDPLATWRKLLLHSTFAMDKHPEMACPKPSTDPDVPTPEPDLDAMQIMLNAIRDAFGVERFSEVDGVSKGLLDGETLKLFFELSFYLADLKKNIKSRPM